MPSLPPLPSERLLIDRLPAFTGNSALVISPGRAQLAMHWADAKAYRSLTAWYLDLYSASTAAKEFGNQVEVVCSADLPVQQFDTVAMPVLKNSDSELTCDLMQQAHQRLKVGGQFAMAINHAGDRWVHEQLQRLYSKVSCDRGPDGCVYWATKHEELKKTKNYEAEFVYRDEGHTIRAISRPGVFAHRRIDAGARQLLNSVEIGPQDAVLDMGCGLGTLTLAAARRTSGAVYGVDSNARAIQCLQHNAQLNELANINAILNADGNFDLPAPIDVALANPPYFGDDAISQHFVDTCLAHLRTGGALLVVTKNPRWYHGYFENRLDDVAIFESAKYYVCCGCKKA